MGIVLFEDTAAAKRQRIKEKYALDDIYDTWLVNKLCDPHAIDYAPSNVIYSHGKMWRKSDVLER
jgi:hypothetical protein